MPINTVRYDGIDYKQSSQQQTNTKNSNSVNGLYKSTSGETVFVKIPKDKRELFTEAFAGRFITKLKQLGYIPAQFHDGLICADICKVTAGDGKTHFGLIQPAMSFTPMFRLFGNPKQANRSTIDEFFHGKELYAKVREPQNHGPGLPIVLLVSLLVGDYSVHSDNVVKLTKGESAGSYGRIDWGAAFRHFADPENNEDILVPEEQKSGFSGFIFGMYKDYIKYFQEIPGLYSALSKRAQALGEVLGQAQLKEIVADVCLHMPTSMFVSKELKEIAKYLGLNPDTNFLMQGETHRRLSEVMTERLSKVAQLEGVAPGVDQEAYVSEAVPQLVEFNATIAVELGNLLDVPEALTKVLTQIDQRLEWVKETYKIADPLHELAATEINFMFHNKEDLVSALADLDTVIDLTMQRDISLDEKELLTALSQASKRLDVFLQKDKLTKCEIKEFKHEIARVQDGFDKIEKNQAIQDKFMQLYQDASESIPSPIKRGYDCRLWGSVTTDQSEGLEEQFTSVLSA